MDYEEFFNAQQCAEERGFINYIDLMKAKKIGTDNGELFSEFCKSDLYDAKDELSVSGREIERYIENNSRSFKTFIEMKKGEFNSEENYRLAKILGVINSDKFNEFKDSRFYYLRYVRDYDKFLYELLRGISSEEEKFKKSYDDFKNFLAKEKEAKDLGFESIEHYKAALSLGFKDPTIYAEFLQSKCKTREEFEFFKNLPHILEIKIKKIDEVVNDAEKAYNSERFEEFIRLTFLSIEKITEALYLKTFRKEVENNDDLKVDDVINKIEIQLNENLVDHEELKYWRRIRNNIIHEHAKIEKDNVEKGKEFFEELFKNLNKYLSN